MAILGTTMSIQGGVHKAVERAAEVEADCVQMHLYPPRSWPKRRAAKATRAATKNASSESEAFRAALDATSVGYPISHASYLINLASPDSELWKKSVDAFVLELERAEMFEVPFVVLHPGAHKDSGEASGIRRIVKALNRIHALTRGYKASCLLENTAGQGSALGWRFEHLGTILKSVDDAYRLGVCIDTCHMFAAGYELRDEDSYKQTMRELNLHIGIKRIKAIHLNDSVRDVGSRVDRHEHIGRGKMGLKPFRFLLNDRRFARVPMYLETPKGEEGGLDLDVINLKRLRRLVRKKK